MADTVTNLQLSKDIGDLKGAVGRIEGLLVGMSTDLTTGRQKFVEIDSRLRAVETKVGGEDFEKVEERLRGVETKVAVYTTIASLGSTLVWFVAQYVIGNLFT